jgi:NADH:ubiquinone oxidoreductase subunit F (NADH-binding)
MACWLRGSERLQEGLAAYARELGPGQVEVGGVSCLGQCDRPVAVSVNDHHVYRGLDEGALRDVIRKAVGREALSHPQADCSPPGWKIDPYGGQPRYEAVQQFLENRDADGLLKKLEVANLRGMGGAGFPTSRKWSAVRGAPGPEKYVVCNADESEPGTFKDRELMRRAPHLLVEGLVLAGLVTGATRGYVYVRHEYAEETEALEAALREARDVHHVVGDNVLGSGLSFPVEVYVSPGGYIQGEESALLEAMEDRRGEPRNKPPFPVFNGLFNRPTVINNVETLCWVPAICQRGGEWYRDQGLNGATGLRFVSVSGDVNRPGVYEVPFGLTVRDLVFGQAGGLPAGRRLKAVAPSGPSGGFLPARVRAGDLPEKFVKEKLPPGAQALDILDLLLDLSTLGLMGSMLGAAFVVYDDSRDMVASALNCTQFFRNESCGKCVPCRVGSQKLVDLTGELLAGKSSRARLGLVGELAEAMTLTSICGLGQVASNPLTSALRHFPEDVERYFAGVR